MVTVFFDIKGVIMQDCVSDGITVKKHYYKNVSFIRTMLQHNQRSQWSSFRPRNPSRYVLITWSSTMWLFFSKIKGIVSGLFQK